MFFNFCLQIFRGLAYIHTVPGVCHRDVKPQNLLVCMHFVSRIFFDFFASVWLFLVVNVTGASAG